MPQFISAGSASSLTSIFLKGLTLQWCHPPLTTVTKLHLCWTHEKMSPDEARAMLSGLPALTHLTVEGDFLCDWLPVGNIQMPSLHSLQIRPRNDWNQFPALLHAISAPLLYSLLLDTVMVDEVDDLVEILDASRYPSLHSLTFIPGPTVLESGYSVLTWRKLMRAFPTVKRFTLSSDDVNCFLRSLDERMRLPELPATPLWPDLHTLTLIDRPGYAAPTLLRDTMSARMTSGCRIRRLQLSKSIMVVLRDDLEWLRGRVEVEEDKLFLGLRDGDSIVRWLDDD
jgi:hypothetical protein